MFSRALEEKFRRSFRSFQEFSGIPAAAQTLISFTLSLRPNILQIFKYTVSVHVTTNGPKNGLTPLS